MRILFVGQLSARKGLRVLLQALLALSDHDLRLDLFGPPVAETRSLLAQVYRAPGPRRCRFMAPHHVCASPKSWPKPMYLVLPSIEDGFGLVLAEAMAAGTPVIASDRTGAGNLVTQGEEGLIIPAGSSEALAQALQTLDRDRDLFGRDGGESRAEGPETLPGARPMPTACLRPFSAKLKR